MRNFRKMGEATGIWEQVAERSHITSLIIYILQNILGRSLSLAILDEI